MRGRRAMSFYMLLLTAIFISIMLIAFLDFVAITGPNYVSPEIGEKQEAVLLARGRAAEFELYAQNTVREAHQRAVKQILTAGVASASYEDLMQQYVETILSDHPADYGYTYDLTVRPGATENKKIVRFDGTAYITVQEQFGSVVRKVTTSEQYMPGAATGSGADERSTGGVSPLVPHFNTYPVAISDRTVTSIFGMRDLGPRTDNHGGIDFRGRATDVSGDPVVAAGDGLAWKRTANAYTVYIQHDNGWMCMYHHITPRSFIPVGERNAVRVSAGEQIAQIAPRGAATNGNVEPHLHFECWNPEKLTEQEALTQYGTHAREHDQDIPGDTLYVSNHIERTLDRARIDPFCLFSGSIRNNISYAPSISGWNYRYGGATQQEQEYETCNAYLRRNLVEEKKAPLPPPPSTELKKLEGWYNATRIALNESYNGPYGSWDRLVDMVHVVAQENGLDTDLAIAMITIESTGRAGVTSQTGVCGLMQVTQDAAHDTIDGETYNGITVSIPPYRDGKVDTHCDPYLQVQAGTKYFANLLASYGGTEEPILFAAAAYNGGRVPITRATALAGGVTPHFEEVAAFITADLLEGVSSYAQRDEQWRESKAKEIVNHARRYAVVLSFMGESVVTQTTQRQTFGQYTFPIDFTYELDIGIAQALLDMQRALARCEQSSASCVSHPYVQHFEQTYAPITRCTTYEDKLVRAFDECKAQYGEAPYCSCRIPIGLLETAFTDDGKTPISVEVEGDVVQANYPETSRVLRFDIASFLPDIEPEVLFYYEEPPTRPLFIVRPAQRTLLLPDTLGQRIGNAVGTFVDRMLGRPVNETTPPDMDAFYVRMTVKDDVSAQFTLAANLSNTCDAVSPERYCFTYEGKQYGFWTDHPVELPVRP